jgi:hypothetical protein
MRVTTLGADLPFDNVSVTARRARASPKPQFAPHRGAVIAKLARSPDGSGGFGEDPFASAWRAVRHHGVNRTNLLDRGRRLSQMLPK